MTRLFAWAALAIFATATGCVHHHHHPGPPQKVVKVKKVGPPPHAPAHGYRHHHHHHPDVQLVFDSGMGVYVVAGWRDHYYYGDHFFKIVHGVWHRSVRFDRGWKVVAVDRVPRGLAKKYRKAKGHKKHHRHPAKHRH